MDYTKNHHLPQWVKSDRIMMDDFNAAFASIEDGLNKTQSNASSGVASVQNNLNAGLSAAQTERTRMLKFLEDISRDAYRQTVQQRVHHGPAGLTDSFWVNSLNSYAEAGKEWAGGYGIKLGGGLATVGGIRASASLVSAIAKGPSYVKPSNTAAFTFTSNGYALLKRINIYSRKNTAEDLPVFSFSITLKRTDTWVIVGQAGPFVSENNPQTESARLYDREVNFPLAPGIPYRMEFSISASEPFRGEAGFTIVHNMYPGTVPLVLEPRVSPVAFSQAITAPEWAQGGTGIVRWSGSGTLTLAANGKALPAVRTRSSSNGVNVSCRETEYRLDALPARTMTLSLQGTKGNGDLDLYDFGMLWR